MRMSKAKHGMARDPQSCPLKDSLLLAVVVMLGVSLSQRTEAAIIQYEVVDLFDPDVIGAKDHWQYRYHVSDIVFEAGQGFDVFFDVGLYEDLDDPPPSVNADWDVQSFQPDPNLPDDGFYDAVAQVDSPSLANPFVVTFAWLGQGIPGSQPFEIFDADFNVIETGQTVPEPTALLAVMVLGLALGVGRRGRCQSSF